jgi:hypothetical protein
MAVSDLVLSLGVKNANAIEEAMEFDRPGPILLKTMRSFHRIDRMVHFSHLVMALG